MITLADITPENRDACIALSVAPAQKGFVAANADSLEEAKTESGMHPVGIYHDGSLVGFAMYGNDEAANQSWIIRFMIDASQQQKGFGTQALEKLVELLSCQYDASPIRLCVEPENEVAIKFYSRYGFAPTGEQWGNELVYERKTTHKIHH